MGHQRIVLKIVRPGDVEARISKEKPARSNAKAARAPTVEVSFVKSCDGKSRPTTLNSLYAERWSDATLSPA